MTRPEEPHTEIDALLEQLRELSRDVSGDAAIRAERLAVLRRLEALLAVPGPSLAAA